MSSYTGAAKYGLGVGQPLTHDVHAASVGAVTHAAQKVGSLDNPMLWLLGIGAVTIGLVAVSTSVRIGPLHASLSGGK